MPSGLPDGVAFFDGGAWCLLSLVFGYPHTPILPGCKSIVFSGLQGVCVRKIVQTKDLWLNSSRQRSCGDSAGGSIVKERSPGFPGLSFLLLVLF